MRRALAAVVSNHHVLTTAELVANATYIELETPDGTQFAPARVAAVDYEANLALLEVDGEEHASIFEGTVPLELAENAVPGDVLEVFQVEDNGVPLLTQGHLRSVDITANFLPNQGFLTYMIKASMQSAASSYSLPVIRDGKLAGVLLTYNSSDQIIDAAATDILRRFLAETIGRSDSQAYSGFPNLGVAAERTEDVSFRRWLKLDGHEGGLYVSRVMSGGAAENAGLKAGDVLLAVGGHAIDRRGYYQHPEYGNLFWSHLVRGERAVGDEIKLEILRDGEEQELKATLTKQDVSEQLVPEHMIDKAPNFLVKGGMVFQELSRPYLEAFGKEWPSRAPLELLDPFQNPQNYEDRMQRVVFLSGVIPTPATVGYESLRNMIVEKVNDTQVVDMASIVAAFDKKLDGIHKIEFADSGLTIYLDEQVANAVDELLINQGLNRLRRTD